MKREVFDRRFPECEPPRVRMSILARAAPPCAMSMGLAPGGRMKQEIFSDPFGIDDWDVNHKSRCFVHIANSLVWREITGRHPPTTPPTAKEYAKAHLPWFDYYDDQAVVLDGAQELAGLKSVAKLGQEKGDVPLPENESVTIATIINLRRNLKNNEVREGTF
jgi:hypothetical protein